MQSILTQLEQERAQAASKNSMYKLGLIGSVLGLALSLLATVSVTQTRNEELLIPAVLVALVSTGGLILFGYLNGKIKKEFATRYKELLTKPLLSEIAPELRYEPTGSISREEFKRSGLYSGFNRYEGEDLISGQLDGLSFQMGQIHAQYRGNKSTRTIFKGRFFMIKSQPFGIQSHTSLRADIAERGFGASIGNFLQNVGSSFSSKKLVKIQDQPEFERLYAVYSDNADEALRICNPKLCDYLLQSNYKGAFLTVSFQRDWIYIGWHSTVDFLNVDINQPVSEQQVQRHGQELTEQLQFMLDFLACLRA